VKYLKKLLMLICGAVATVACQSSDPEKRLSDADYLPLRKGVFQIYDVNSITYSDINPPETLAYQLMTQVTDSFPNQEGYYTYVIHRSTRPDSTADWVALDTWSAKIDGQQAIVSEGNVPFVKIAFPAVNEKKWNGNAFNDKDADNYSIQSARTTATVNGKSYQDCITIIQHDDDNLVNTDIRKEIYSRKTGLIYVEKTQLNYCTDIDCFGQKQIKNGLIYKQAIRNYGSN